MTKVHRFNLKAKQKDKLNDAQQFKVFISQKSIYFKKYSTHKNMNREQGFFILFTVNKAVSSNKNSC